MKNLRISLDTENLNYLVINDQNGNFVKNETGGKHLFSNRHHAQDVVDALSGNTTHPSHNAIRAIFSI